MLYLILTISCNWWHLETICLLCLIETVCLQTELSLIEEGNAKLKADGAHRTAYIQGASHYNYYSLLGDSRCMIVCLSTEARAPENLSRIISVTRQILQVLIFTCRFWPFGAINLTTKRATCLRLNSLHNFVCSRDFLWRSRLDEQTQYIHVQTSLRY